MSLYFLIFYPRTKKEDKNGIKFFVPENKKDRPKCIYTEENYENNNYYYKKICKAPKSAVAKNEKLKKSNNNIREMGRFSPLESFLYPTKPIYTNKFL